MSVEMMEDAESNPGPSSRSSSMDSDIKSISSVTESVGRTIEDLSNAKTQNNKPIDKDDAKMCQDCYNEESGVAFFPCHHMVACIKCVRDMSTCAVCREPVTMTRRVRLGEIECETNKDTESDPGLSSQSSSMDSDIKSCHDPEMNTILELVTGIYFLVMM